MRLKQFESSIIAKKGILNKQLYGNEETLKDAKLVDFFNKNYSSNLMTLSIIGNSSLNQLQELTRHFEVLKNNNTDVETYKNLGNQFEGLGAVYRIPPVSDSRQELLIKWPWLPDQRANWRCRPFHYIVSSLSEPLMAALVKQELATSVDCQHSDILRRTKTTFIIKITLTNTGVKHYKKVIQTVFKQINSLRRCTPPRYIFDELQEKDQADFSKYDIADNPLKYSQFLAETLSKNEPKELYELPISNLLRKNFALETHRPDLIHKILEQMKPQNCYIVFLSRMHKNFLPPLTFETEPYYGTEYCKEPFTHEFVQELQAQESETGYPKRKIPVKTEEKKYEYEFINKQDKGPPVGLAKLIRGGSDEQMKNSDARPSRIWFRQHDAEGKPTIWARVKVMTNDSDFDTTPQYHTYLLLWERLMRMYIKEDWEDANSKQTWWDVQFVSDDLYFSISLLSHKQENIMDFANVFSKLSTFKPSKESFDKVTEEIRLAQECQVKLSESFLAAAWYKKLLLEPLHFTPEEIEAATFQVNYTDFNRFHNNLMKNLHFEWLIQGHLLQQQAETLVNDSEHKLNFVQAITDNDLARMRRMQVQLERGTVYQLAKKNKRDVNPNSCVLISFVMKKRSIEQKVRMDILSELIAEEFCEEMESVFGERCVTQAAYKSRLKHDYLDFRIMSSNKNPHYMEFKINCFLKEQKGKFSAYADAIEVVKHGLERRAGVQVEARKNWRAIVDSNGAPDFANIRHQETAALKSTTLSDIESLFSDIMTAPRVHIYVYSHQNLQDKEQLEKCKQLNNDFYKDKKIELIEDIQAFQERTLKV